MLNIKIRTVVRLLRILPIVCGRRSDKAFAALGVLRRAGFQARPSSSEFVQRRQVATHQAELLLLGRGIVSLTGGER